MPLAPRQLDPIGKALADHLVIARGQLVDHPVGKGAFGGGLDPGAVVAGLDPADGDIVGGGHVVADEILKDHAHRRAQAGQVIVAQVAAIQQDAALVGVVKAGQQFDQGGFARAVFAH